MLSALSTSDTLLGNPFGAFHDVFMAWDCPDILFTLEPTSPNPVTSSSGSDGFNQTHHAEEKPSSGDSNRDVSIMNERKRRRMISNRESARRSRMRKQRHLEKLRNQVNLFRVQNSELNNRLEFMMYHSNRIRTENDWLRSERTLLRQKLSNISQFLFFQQVQPFSPPAYIAMQQ